jgi:hypothetical protein
MPKGRKPKNDGGNVVEMQPDTPDAETIDPIIEAQAAPPIEAEPEPARIEITAPETRAGQKRSISFFDRVRKVTKADWGTRAFIYVYCLEPICDLKMGGEKKYLVKLKEPIFDEDSIMIDYGSGKYRLNLVARKPGAAQNDQIDVCEIEIYNPKFPPKIPQSVWINDPRNERWAALIPKPEAPKPDTPMGSITETFKVFSDMRKDVREELKPGTDAASASNPVATALSMAKDLLQMRAENPMVDVMRDEMKAMREEMKEEREENRKLQAELRQKQAPATEVEKSDPIDTLVKAADKLEPFINRFMNKGGELASTVVNGRRPKVWETMLENAVGPFIDFLKPIGVALAMKMAAPNTNPAAVNGGDAPAPAPQTAPGIAGPQQPAPAQPPKLVTFLGQPIVMGAFQSYFKSFVANANDNNGGDFAQWIFDAVGEAPLVDARAMGTQGILNLLKAAPQWPMMQPHESKLTEFLNQALTWKPDALMPDDDGDGPTDLTAM